MAYPTKPPAVQPELVWIERNTHKLVGAESHTQTAAVPGGYLVKQVEERYTGPDGSIQVAVSICFVPVEELVHLS